MKRLEPGTAEAVATAISLEIDRKILISTATEPRSGEEISIETGIPLATCYRKVNELMRDSLLGV